MEEKVIDIKEEFGTMIVTDPKTGTQYPVNAKTVYTSYDSGRKDCAITLEKPIGMGGESVVLGK